uniref:manganese transport system ATP-binding protein n=1 Tax=Rhodaphanes brevistipitata TaxID=446136 RepID=UPI001FCDB234|nr:manganese transport system ATP-binding protein [Rhodaphanes brevistipitata]UNJ18436.1 manganese transport system ATP-binding protein [Rhodaphanes brevistipitata]
MHKSLIVSQLNVKYSNHTILKNINFKISSGKIIGIIGPNGAGKSTLLKAILGLIPNVSGKIEYNGNQLKSQKNKMAYVPQRSQIDWDYPITVQDVALMGQTFQTPWGLNYSKKSYELVNYALQRLGLYEIRHNRIGELSGGQQQKVFLARSLAQEAEIFFLDEPLIGVDYKTQDIIFNLLTQLTLENKMIIIIHHDLGDVLQYFNELILLNQIIVAQGNCKQVLENQILSLAYH